MEGLIPFLIIAFVVYRFIRKINPEEWRRLFEQQQAKQTGLKQIPRSESATYDRQEVIRTFLAGNSRPSLKRVAASSESHDLFKEDKWRRQLFIVCLLIGLSGLVYLLII